MVPTSTRTRDVHQLDRQLAELVRRRDQRQDDLIGALIDVDVITKRIATLIDRRCDLLDDGR